MKNIHTLLLIHFLPILGFAGFATLNEGCYAKHVIAFTGDYTDSIDSKELFDTLKGEPLSDKYSEAEAVKIIYDVETKKTYFVASTKYRYHFDFCEKVLHYQYGLNYFNETNYSHNKDRRYYLATLNHFISADMYTIEFVGSDESTAEEVTEFFNAVKEKTFFGKDLKLLLNTSNLIRMANTGSLHLPSVNPDEVFTGQSFQSVNTGLVYGYLKKIDTLKTGASKIQPHDIILIRENPNELPLCAGIITTQFQTPLSHINILCHNRGTACFAYTKAWADEKINSYDGKLVMLLVSSYDYTITLADSAEALQFWNKRETGKTLKLKSDLEVKQLFDIAGLSGKSEKIVGSKAANFAEMANVQKKNSELFKIPQGAFAIPFYYYHEHIHKPSVDSLIHQLHTDTAIQNNTLLLKDQLKKIRRAIKETPVNPDLLKQIEQKIKSNGAGNAYRFRSSTNAEDLPGFNGAGLYDSKTGILNDSVKTIEKAIAEVWASAFTYRAYTERALFHIDEETVNMGILVHRAFPNETANGVAITKNLYRPDFPGFVVNVQVNEISVVAPEDGIFCDQLICCDASELNKPGNQVVSEYITFSNQNKGQPVLTDAQISTLYKALQAVKYHFYYSSDWASGMTYDDFALDVEFKFEGDILYIKQVRPFK